MLPENQWVQFDVTSLDVIHSFWAYQLGVKADANPNVNNIAYAKPTQLGQFTVRCAELCGLWHGAMFDYGKVVTVGPVPVLGGRDEVVHGRRHQAAAGLRDHLRPDRDPRVPQRSVMKKLGLTSAGGGFYPPQDPVQP